MKQSRLQYRNKRTLLLFRVPTYQDVSQTDQMMVKYADHIRKTGLHRAYYVLLCPDETVHSLQIESFPHMVR